MKKPEKSLHDAARKMLEIILSDTSTEVEAGMAYSTLLEILAPDDLQKLSSIGY